MRRVAVAVLALVSLFASLSTPAAARGPNEARAPRREPRAAGAAIAAATDAKVLVYGPTSGGYADTTPGVTATVWDEATWAAASTSEFSQFDAIVFGDQPICFGDPGVWDTAVANRQVWSAAVSGNVIVNGTDPDWHGKSQFVHQSVAFAAADAAPGPGLYVSLSCAYHSGSPAEVELLGGLGHFTVQGVNNCPNAAHKIAAHPTLDGLDDSYLGNWSCSAHEIFSSWPSSYQPLVIIGDAAPSPAPPVYTAPDGTSGHVYVLARGQSFLCDEANDSDGDCLTDAVEGDLGTDAHNPDTDGDGLKDSWEVDPGVQGAGIQLPSGELVHRDAALGPFSNLPRGLYGWPFCPGGTDDQRRITARPYRCFNHAPDPLHKDVFVELDWQDCFVEFACPEVISEHDDPLHHAPSLSGLREAMEMFDDAPVSNPDGVDGVRLHVLVDEAIPHAPNCDQNSSIGRSESFGTPAQRRDGAVLDARTMSVRYVWSGHSSARDGVAACPNPGRVDFLLQGIDAAPLADYDWSPFGDANVRGRDILVTMGPAWSCSSQIGEPRTGNTGPCFRETDLSQLADNPLGFLMDPGIFPANIPNPGDDRIRWPVHMLLGELEADAIEQLWSRALSHLLGHSLGLDEGDVHNQPAPAGRHQSGEHSPLTPLQPESYGSWSGLSYAPAGVGTDIQDAFPNYDELARTNSDLSDADADGDLQHDDNCPLVHNPDQDNTDFGPWYLQILGGRLPNIAEFGDACDPDIDGDGERNPAPGEGESLMAAAADVDPYPYDTDDDAVDNVDDPDDDGDGVADGADNCRIHPNAGQGDLDGDGFGDACELDTDGDQVMNQVEALLGADHRDPASAPEYAGYDGSCTNGDDDDGDGAADGADPGCADGDGDQVADGDDNCPDLANAVNVDRDGDGVGDACQLLARVEYVSADAIGVTGTGTEIGWSATASGSFTVRVGGSGCADGTVVDSGTYDRGDGTTARPAFTFVGVGSLAEGDNTVRVCVTSGASSASATAAVLVDRVAPDTAVLAGPAEGASTGADVTIELGGSESPLAFLCALDGAALGPCEPTVAYTALAAGPHTFTAVAFDRAGNEDPTPVTRSFSVGGQGRFEGFFAPVDNIPVVNRMKAGRAVPVRFRLEGASGLAIFAAGYPASARMDCATGAALDPVEETVSAGGSSLHHDDATGTYEYVWDTRSAWAGTCRVLILRFRDGSEARAWFRLT
jgi:hypothetical protein